jgi:hypothetical protein
MRRIPLVTLGDALKTIKAKVKAGNWVITPHVFRDHPERAINAAEVMGAILTSFTIALNQRRTSTG